jgi:hypothetical protein
MQTAYVSEEISNRWLLYRVIEEYRNRFLTLFYLTKEVNDAEIIKRKTIAY